MKKSFLILTLAGIILNSGCRKVILKWYGVKKPDYETTNSIEKFKMEVFGDTIPLLIARHDVWTSGKILSIPDVFVFNKAGLYIPYKDSLRPNCNGPAEVFLGELNSDRNYHFSPEYTLNDFLGKLEMSGCRHISSFVEGQNDFYVFFTWANWTGKKIYNEKTLEWLRVLNKNKNINYKIILVNQDLQECWSDEQKALLELKSSSTK